LKIFFVDAHLQGLRFAKGQFLDWIRADPIQHLVPFLSPALIQPFQTRFRTEIQCVALARHGHQRVKSEASMLRVKRRQTVMAAPVLFESQPEGEAARGVGVHAPCLTQGQPFFLEFFNAGKLLGA
jgi:hypothetical protein